MKSLQPGILIIHNLPRSKSSEDELHPYTESDEGVMDQVLAVSESLAQNRIPYRIIAIKDIQELPSTLASSPERIVFNLMETSLQSPAEATLVPAICLAHRKMCTGGDTLSLMIGLHKWYGKALLRQAGIPVPEGVIIPIGGRIKPADLPSGLLIVKPVAADASEGIDSRSVVDGGGGALERAVQRVHSQMRQPALIERFFGQRELNIAVIQRRGVPEALPIAEIDFSTFSPEYPRIVDYAAKWLPDTFQFRNTPRIIPAQIPAPVAKRIRQYALRAWHALNCRDYVRVDLRLNNQGEVTILEVNPNPDISPEGGMAAALEEAGIPFDEFIRAMCRNAAARYEERFGRPQPRRRRFMVLPRGATIRRTEARDRPMILSFLQETDFFRPPEVDIAKEVLDQAITKGKRGHYQSFAIDVKGKPVAWLCFGPTPCTDGTYDIYWLVVDSRHQNRGFGRALLERAEKLIRNRKGRLILVDTSSRPLYDVTRAFYSKTGYEVATRIRDFYAPGDDRIVYAKRLAP